MSYDEHLISMAGGDGDNDTADVLAGIISKALGDVTGIYDTTDAEDKAIADAILAAGFGLVREAQAVALEEAADEFATRSDTLLKTMQNMADSREYELADIVRYGAFSAEAKATEARLRARAVTVRGGE